MKANKWTRRIELGDLVYCNDTYILYLRITYHLVMLGVVSMRFDWITLDIHV